jgi:hypothetical protein
LIKKESFVIEIIFKNQGIRCSAKCMVSGGMAELANAFVVHPRDPG